MVHVNCLTTYLRTMVFSIGGVGWGAGWGQAAPSHVQVGPNSICWAGNMKVICLQLLTGTVLYSETNLHINFSVEKFHPWALHTFKFIFNCCYAMWSWKKLQTQWLVSMFASIKQTCDLLLEKNIQLLIFSSKKHNFCSKFSGCYFEYKLLTTRDH
jgi:hypothetical protein